MGVVTDHPFLQFLVNFSQVILLDLSFSLNLFSIMFFQDSERVFVVMTVKSLSWIIIGMVLSQIEIFSFSLDILLKFFVNFGLFIACNLQSKKSDNEFPSPEEVGFQIFVFNAKGVKEFSFKSFVDVFDDFLVFLDSTVDVSSITVIYGLDQNLLDTKFEDLEEFPERTFIHDDRVNFVHSFLVLSLLPLVKGFKRTLESAEFVWR
jgi:hypothetical protein